jgi:uncharacterized protein
MSNHFAIFTWDAPNSAEPRAAAQQAHMRHIDAVFEKIAIAGPIRDADGRSIGSLFVLKASTAEEAETILRADPYFKAGVWERWEVHPFLPAAGEWIGGKIW